MPLSWERLMTNSISLSWLVLVELAKLFNPLPSLFLV